MKIPPSIITMITEEIARLSQVLDKQTKLLNEHQNRVHEQKKLRDHVIKRIQELENYLQSNGIPTKKP